MPLDATEQRLVEAIGRRRDAMFADLERFVAIPTGMNHSAGLDELRGIFAERLGALGAEVRLVQGDPRPAWIDRGEGGGVTPPTLVARRAGTSSGRLLLCGHLDTVHDPNGPFRTLTFRGDGLTATGPGCADMKGGLIVAVHALSALAEAGVDLSWGFVLNSDEEVGSYHSDVALRDEAVAEYTAGLVFEPALPDGSLVVERPGSGQFYLETRGVAAHVGRDFRHGVSAIVSMAECITAVHAMADVDRGLITNVGVIEGGTATNVVPDRCRAWGNVRFKSEEIAEEIRAGLDGLARPNAVAGVRVEQSFNRPAKPFTEETRQLAEHARRAAEDLGQQLPFGKTGGVCDGNILQAVGLPTIDTLGVRGGGLHTPDEWIELASLVDRCRLAALLMARLAG